LISEKPGGTSLPFNSTMEAGMVGIGVDVSIAVGGEAEVSVGNDVYVSAGAGKVIVLVEG